MAISDVDPYFEFPSRATPQEHLISLVKGLKEFLWHLSELNWTLIDSNGFATPLLPEDIWEDMNRALEELNPHFQQLINKTQTLELATLAANGLTEDNLRVKTKVPTKFWEFFKNNPFKDALKNLLEAIDVAIGSLIKAAGLGDAIEELKDTLKVSLAL